MWKYAPKWSGVKYLLRIYWINSHRLCLTQWLGTVVVRRGDGLLATLLVVVCDAQENNRHVRFIIVFVMFAVVVIAVVSHSNVFRPSSGTHDKALVTSLLPWPLKAPWLYLYNGWYATRGFHRSPELQQRTLFAVGNFLTSDHLTLMILWLRLYFSCC